MHSENGKVYAENSTLHKENSALQMENCITESKIDALHTKMHIEINFRKYIYTYVK